MDDRTPLPPLRPLDVTRVHHEGRDYFVLRDPLELGGPEPLLLPVALAPVLVLLDGTTSAAEAARRLIDSGIEASATDILGLVDQLSTACLLDDAIAAAAHAAARAAYRAAPFRLPALAGRVYPADPSALRAQLERYRPVRHSSLPTHSITGVISPHIDYARGGPVYARLWREVQDAARAADVVVIFGTDHAGDLGRVTLTVQDYATPWGRLPTDVVARAAMEDALGAMAFDEELHHRTEHSIELAAVWLHHARHGEPVPLVPVLCGHPGAAMAAGRIDTDAPAGKAVAALRAALAGRRVLAVAAADLAHVGLRFGDAAPAGSRERALVRAADEELVAACVDGAPGVLRAAGRIDDRYRICGLAPIACLLELIGPAQPEVYAYDQCDADPDGGSFVLIAGVALRTA